MFIDLIYKIAVKCEMHTYTMCPKQYVNCHCSVLNKDKVSVYIYRKNRQHFATFFKIRCTTSMFMKTLYKVYKLKITQNKCVFSRTTCHSQYYNLDVDSIQRS